MNIKFLKAKIFKKKLNYLKKTTNNFHSQNLKETNRIKNINFIKQSFYYYNKMKS